MKKNVKQLVNRIIVFLLSFFGITSISSCMYGIPDDAIPGEAVAMYGVPGNFYEIEGTVIGDINQDGTIDEAEVIPNIKITVKKNDSSNSKNDDSYSDPAEMFLETAVTDENGSFEMYFNDFMAADNFVLTFTDTDGETNGSFETKTMEINFDKSEMESQTAFGNENYKKSLGKIELKTKLNK